VIVDGDGDVKVAERRVTPSHVAVHADDYAHVHGL